jgi:hypothetical protein
MRYESPVDGCGFMKGTPEEILGLKFSLDLSGDPDYSNRALEVLDEMGRRRNAPFP